MSDPHFSRDISTVKKHLVAVFAAAAACILTAGFAYHHRYQKAIEKDTAELLSSIRHFKTEQIIFWRADRLNDTNSLLDSPVLSTYLNRLTANPGDKELQALMRSRLEHYLKYYRYNTAIIVWPDGKILISAGKPVKALPAETRELLAKTASSGKSELGDFYLNPEGKPQLDLAGRAGSAGEKNIFLVLTIAPEEYLYPLISKWPTNSVTGETILARQEGDDVIALTEFKLPEGAPLRKLAALNTELPAAKALLGEIGTVFGTDYRGEKVLASVGMIPYTGWAIVVKMDWDEIMADAGRGSVLILLFTLFMLLTAGVVVYLLFRLQETGYDRSLKEAVSEKERYRFSYETLSDRANDMIFLADPRERALLMVNTKACSTYGYTKEEMLRLKPENLLAPEKLSEFNRRFKALEKGASLIYESVHLKKGGQPFPIEVSATGVTLEGRQLVYFICRDITERKRMENELKEKERALGRVMYNLPGMAYRCKNDPRWTMEFVSQGCETLTGYKPAELLGNNAISYNDIISPDDRDRVWREVQTALNAEKPYQLIYRIRRKDGQIRTVWEQGGGVKAGGGATPETIEGLVIDNTDKADVEEALRRSETRYYQLFNSMEEGFATHEIICDEKGEPVDYRWLEVNPAFEKLTGLKKENIIGRRAREVLPKLEEDWIRNFGKVAITGTPMHFENRAADLDRWYEVSVFSPRRGEFAVTFFDITSRKEAEFRTDNLNRELQKNLRLSNILGQLNQAAAQAKDRNKLFERICEVAVSSGKFKMAWIGYPDRDTGRVLPLNFFAEAGADHASITNFLYKGSAYKGPTGEAASGGRISVCQDIAGWQADESWREKAAGMGYASAASIPVYNGGKLTALLTLYSAARNAFSEEEIAMFASIQAEINLAVEGIYAEEQRAETQAALERTADHLAHAMEATPIILFTLHFTHGRVIMQWVTGNPKGLTGHDTDELFLPGWFEGSLHPGEKARVIAEVADVFGKGTVTHDFRLKKKDGRGYVWVRGNIKARPDSPVEITGTWTDITQLKEAELRCRVALETRAAEEQKPE